MDHPKDYSIFMESNNINLMCGSDMSLRIGESTPSDSYIHNIKLDRMSEKIQLQTLTTFALV